MGNPYHDVYGRFTGPGHGGSGTTKVSTHKISTGERSTRGLIKSGRKREGFGARVAKIQGMAKKRKFHSGRTKPIWKSVF